MITEPDNARESIGDGALTPTTRNPPTARQLHELANGANYAEAAALLEGVDLGADLGADFQYHAGVCLGSVGQQEAAIDLLKRAAAGGFAGFWCAYHLGLFEMRRGKDANAACYYTVSLISEPERTDVYPLLEKVAPGIDLASLHAAQSGTRSIAAARAALDLGMAKLDLDQLGAAAHYFTAALALDPEQAEARARLLELTPDIALAVLPATDDDRLRAEASAPRSALEEDVSALTPTTRNPPTAQQLHELANSANYAEATALLEGVDLDADFGTDFQYYAGVCLGSVGQQEAAINLLRLAAAGGYAQFWCAFHLGLFEMRRGRTVDAAYYYTVSLILDPARADIYPLLERVAPEIEIAALDAAHAEAHSVVAAQDNFALGNASLEAGGNDKRATAAFYFTIAAVLDPTDGGARTRLREIAPDISLDVLPQRTAPPTERGFPALQDLEQLVDSGKYQEAAALLEGVDLEGDFGAKFHYYAGVALGSVGRDEAAIDLLKRAVAGGFAQFWCAFHLGLFEMRRGKGVNAAYYLTVALIAEPERTDLYPLLGRVAPDLELTSLRTAQAGTRSTAAARAAFDLGAAARDAGNPGAAAHYFTGVLALDPQRDNARAELLALAPDISFAVLPGIDGTIGNEVAAGEVAGGSPPVSRSPPTAQQLEVLVDNMKYDEASALLEDVDFEADLGADVEYYAGVALGSVGEVERAIGLLKRASAGGFATFWCAYHLGLFEMKRGNAANAAAYFSACLIMNPARTDIYPLLARVAPDIDLVPLRAAQATRPVRLARDISRASPTGIDGAFAHRAPMAASASAPPAAPGSPPTALQLQQLANGGKYREAVALLEDVDFAADLPPDFQYLAGVCLGSVNKEQLAIDLLKRAVEGGYPRFWCAYHLGLFEEKLGRSARAAYYYTVALLWDPARTDIRELLARVAPDAEIALWPEAEAAGMSSGRYAREACRRGDEKLQAGRLGAATCFFATALALAPLCEEARSRLLELAPGISLDVLTAVDMDRLAVELHEKLTAPPLEEFDLQRKLAWAEAIFQIYSNNQDPSGRTLIPALEAVLHRALAARQIDLDTLCLYHDKMYFLYWYWSSSWEAMRGVAEGAMKPLAAAVRDRTIQGLPAIAQRALGAEPLRLGYLAEFALLGNPIGRGVGDLLEVLSRYFPDTYGLVLYAWSQFDDAFLAGPIEHGVTVRRFSASSMSERIGAVAQAIAADEIDILITDMNSALPAVLFERRAAPVQIFFQNGLPYWPLANIDGVFRIEFYDPALDGFAPEICFDVGLGAWQQRGYDHDPPVDLALIAAERARFPDAAKLIGIYGRLAKVTPEFLEMIREVLIRHPQVVALVGGTGYGKWIRDFIADRGLAGRLVLVDEYVDGHVWGHMIDVFVDTSWDVTVAGREVMVKGKPIVSLRTPTHERERVPMLIADDRATYIDLVSRLIEDPDFYEAACAATRDFVAAQPGEREFAAAVHDALQATVGRVRSRAATVDARRLIAFNRLEPRSVLDLLKSEKPQSVETADFPGGKPVEVVRVDELVYLPERHLQVWRNHIIPVEANTDPDAVPLIFSSNHDIRTHKDLLIANTLDEEVCILSNVHSYNFYHFIEELYKVVVLERHGFAGRYVVSPFPSWIAASLPTFALELLGLLGIAEERMLSVAAPTLFRNAWLTSHIAHNNVADHPAVFFALRDALLAAAEGPSLGPRLWLDRGGRHRAVVNREEVDECLQRHGVTAVEMSELPVARQIAAVAAADTLVGLHGASFVHSMFLQPGSTVIECFSPEYLHPCMLDVCALLGHRYFNLTYPAAPSYETGQLAARIYKYGGDIAVDCNHLDFLLQSLTAVHDAPSTTVGRVRTQPKSAETAPNPAFDRLSRRSVLDELRSSAPSRVVEVDFGPGGKPVEIGAAGEVLYLPALHLQLWRNTVVPCEANFAAFAFIELQEDIRLGDIQLVRPLDKVDEIDSEVCILSNLYSNNFFHFFEELYKVTILERSGFQGRYVLSPFGDRHSSGLPPFATEFLELLGIPDDRIIMCRKPTVFRSSWLTTPIGCWDTIAYGNVFLALRAALIAAAAATATGIGPRLYLERYPKRVVVNAQEVRECVSRYGFTTVDMARLPVAEQIAAAHHAEVLVGPHGSSMLHCAFQEKKSTVIECFSPEYMDFFILDILHILEHRYFQIVAMDRRMVSPYNYGADVAIDCHHLELVLKQLP